MYPRINKHNQLDKMKNKLHTMAIILGLLLFPAGVWGQETWTEVSTAEALRGIFNNGGNAKLTANIGDHGLTVTCTTTPVKLDLNGHTLSENYTFSDFRGPVITINSGCTVTILDTQGGGCITGGQTNGGKGAGISNSGTLTINGGTITGNNAPIENTVSGYGGAIHNAQYATLTINGGVITGNNAHNAGGIYNEGDMYLRGGSICNNNNNTINSLSSGIYNTSTATLTISGNPIVEGNGYGDIFLQEGMKITIDGELTGNEESIGIKMQTPGVFTTGLRTGGRNAEGHRKFIFDNSGYDSWYTSNDNNGEAISRWEWECLVDRFAAGGTIKLKKNYTANAASDGCLTVPAGKSVTLDLNGKIIDRGLLNYNAKTDGCVIKNLSVLTIQDTSVGEPGKIQNGRNSGNGGGIYNEGTLTISGGEIYGCRTYDGGHGGGIYNNGGSVNITGGNIISNTCINGNGGGIYNASGTLSISGGEISRNNIQYKTARGAGIYFAAGTFNLQGNPKIYDGNDIYYHVNYNLYYILNNIYLAAGQKINITGDLTGTDEQIGITMEMPGEFTTGLNSHGTYAKFKSDENYYYAGGSYNLQPVSTPMFELTTNGNNEAQMQSFWSKLQAEITTKAESGGTVTLNRNYTAHPTDGPLTVDAGKTVTINMSTYGLNRNLLEPRADGCVIKNFGTLTLSGTGRIEGGYNDGNGGGIYNAGALTLQGSDNDNKYLAVSDNRVNDGHFGAGIFHDTSATLLAIQHNYYCLSNYIGSGWSNPSNVYLSHGKIITVNSLNSHSRIGITHEDNKIVFTSGLGWNSSNTLPFSADDSSTKYVARVSSGEAIIGPFYTISSAKTGEGSISIATKAVGGAEVLFSISAETGHVPYSLSYTPEGGAATPIACWDNATNYAFTMPDANTTVNVDFRQGGFCGATGHEHEMKYFLDGSTLKFLTQNDGNCAMTPFASANDVLWKEFSYTAVNLSDHMTSISPYAFFGSGISSISIPASVTSIGTFALANCQSLETLTVSGANFTGYGNVLYNSDKSTLICYPAGLTAETYTLPNTVTAINDGAFAYNTHLTTINVETGGTTPFSATDGVLYKVTELYCYPARKIGDVYDVASTVTEIKPYAFHNNNILKAVNFCKGSVPTGGTAMFDNTTFKIMVKKDLKTGGVGKYDGTSPWSNAEYINRTYEMDLTKATIALAAGPVEDDGFYDYHGVAIKPTVTSVTYKPIPSNDFTLTLREGIDYETINDGKYSNNNAIGTGTITFTGAGGYSGTNTTKDFDITKKIVLGNITGEYATYYDGTDNLNKPINADHGYTIYLVTGISWGSNPIVVTLTSINYIPANRPVLLYNYNNYLSNQTFHLTKYTPSSALPTTSNDFIGITSNTNYKDLITTGKDAIYALKGNNFVRATGGTLAAHRCYIAKPTTAGARSHAPAYLTIGNGNSDTTDIEVEDIKIDKFFSNEWYTLDGKKLDGMPTTKGIYLNNGMKVVIK